MTAPLRTSAKVALVAAGYVAAGLIATAAVALHMALTASDSRGADGMYAFGDALLFLFVFGVVALVPTAAAVYFIRTRK